MVLADNTFSLKNSRFEAPRDLRNRKIVGEPGTGKSVIKHALCQHDPKRIMSA